LNVLAHPLPVEIERRAIVADEPPIALHGDEVLAGLRVHPRIVRVDPRVEVDLGFHHVQERVRVPLREYARLVRIENVVREARDLRGEIGAGSQAAQRLHIHRGFSAPEVNMRR
jgi:hypothetical protein